MPFTIQPIFRSVYCLLFLAQFLRILPFGQTYFVTERFKGCIESNPWFDRFFNPLTYRLYLVVWLGSLVLLALDVAPLWTVSIHLFFCHIFFVRLRWKSLTRGMGAPGLVPTWIAVLLFLLEYCRKYGDFAGHLRWLILSVFQIDFAISMMDSGFNKVMHGYPLNHGMNWGMANPAWSYSPSFFKRLPFCHPLFVLSNHAAYIFQILGGLLMLIPSLRWVGAFVIFMGFFGVHLAIRLGVLCDMLMLITTLYTHSGGWLDQILQPFARSAVLVPSAAPHGVPLALNLILEISLWFYVILLPFAKLAMYYNFYGRRSFPQPFQRILETFTNLFGIILWRVFTVETVDFFIEIDFEDRNSKKRMRYTRYGRWKWNQNNRFLWVGESLMSNVLFNTERYFPHTQLLHQRLLRYANTMPFPENSVVIFQYVAIVPDEKGYHYIPAKEYIVDVIQQKTEIRILTDAIKVPLQHPSPVRASLKAGSYAPALGEGKG